MQQFLLFTEACRNVKLMSDWNLKATRFPNANTQILRETTFGNLYDCYSRKRQELTSHDKRIGCWLRAEPTYSLWSYELFIVTSRPIASSDSMSPTRSYHLLSAVIPKAHSHRTCSDCELLVLFCSVYSRRREWKLNNLRSHGTNWTEVDTGQWTLSSSV